MLTKLEKIAIGRLRNAANLSGYTRQSWTCEETCLPGIPSVSRLVKFALVAHTPSKKGTDIVLYQIMVEEDGEYIPLPNDIIKNGLMLSDYERNENLTVVDGIAFIKGPKASMTAWNPSVCGRLGCANSNAYVLLRKRVERVCVAWLFRDKVQTPLDISIVNGHLATIQKFVLEMTPMRDEFDYTHGYIQRNISTKQTRISSYRDRLEKIDARLSELHTGRSNAIEVLTGFGFKIDETI